MRAQRKPSPSAPLQDITFRYAVVDLAAAPALAPHVMGRLSQEAQTLFAPNMHVNILRVGPWLARLERVPELEAAIDALPPDTPWGYVLETSIDIVSLRRALRRYNYVRVPNQPKPVLFRYWDPRVMKTFISVATREQRDVLFEFINRIEGPGGLYAVKPKD